MLDMSADTRLVGDYGWSNANEPCSHIYLLPTLVTLCQRLEAKRVLDLGCGNGALSHGLATAGFEVVGCDADAKGVAYARENRKSTARFEVVSVYDKPQSLGRTDFDIVIAAEVIEHLFLPRHLPQFARGVLRPGGRLIVTTPYHGYLKNLALSIFDKWDHHHTALWDGGHIKFWSRATLRKLLEGDGFVVEDFMGVGRVPLLWKSMIMVARSAP